MESSSAVLRRQQGGCDIQPGLPTIPIACGVSIREWFDRVACLPISNRPGRSTSMRRSDRTWRLDHFSSVAQTYSVPSSIGLHDGACAVIGLVTGPIALQLEQDLDPGCHACSSGFHSTESKIMACGSQTS